MTEIAESNFISQTILTYVLSITLALKYNENIQRRLHQKAYQTNNPSKYVYFQPIRLWKFRYGVKNPFGTISECK